MINKFSSEVIKKNKNKFAKKFLPPEKSNFLINQFLIKLESANIDLRETEK